jgi:hypothetical protein
MSDPAITPPDGGRHVGHETTDASPATLGLFALALSLMVVIVLLFLTWLFSQFEAEAKRADKPQTPLAENEPPPPPRLEVDPGADLARVRSAEQKALTTYGWIDREQGERGVVRLPINRAIALLAERGLPEPKAKSADPKREEPKKDEPKKDESSEKKTETKPEQEKSPKEETSK